MSSKAPLSQKLCACGCGIAISEFDTKDRPKTFAHGHNGRKQGIEAEVAKSERREKARQRSRRYYNDNRARLQAERADNPSLQRARNKVYYEQNQQKEIARAKKYTAENKEAVYEKNRARKRATRPQQSVYEANRRARVMGAAGTHTLSLWLNRVAFFGWRCRYCGLALTINTLTKDHTKPLIRGGSNWPSNLVPACFSCNSKKQAQPLAQFLASKSTVGV